MPQLTLQYLLLIAGFVALFWRMSGRLRPYLLAMAGSGFLLAWDPVSFGLLVTLTVAVYGLARRRTPALWRAGLLGLVLLFGALKTWAALGQHEVLPAIVIPLGFGFYILKLVHYWIDSDFGEIESHSFLQFYNYMFFFPTLLVGPIHRFGPFLRCERRMRWDAAKFAEGLRRILYGYAKVVILANWVIAYLLRGYLFEHTAPDTSPWVFCEGLTYGLYLYLAFAGYSDIAIGISMLLGQTICENFRYPFLRRNIAEFWRCWHMSLSDWCRRYIFTPALARWRRPSLAVIATMFTIGLWHEFTMRYVLWGLYHGVGLSVHRVYAARIATRFPVTENRMLRGLGAGVSIAATFLFVMVGFNITKNDSIVETVDDFKILLFGWDNG